MGVTYEPCEFCNGVYCTSGDYCTCTVCDAHGCMDCESEFTKQYLYKRGASANEKPTTISVCTKCLNPSEPSNDEVWQQLVKLYHALPGANHALRTQDDIRMYIKRHDGQREPKYAAWKRTHKYVDEDDNVYPAADFSDTEPAAVDDDDTPPAKRAHHNPDYAATTAAVPRKDAINEASAPTTIAAAPKQQCE